MSDHLTTTCPAEDHSWRVRAGDFKFVGYRNEGGIINRVRRVCERCPTYVEADETSWGENDRRYTVENVVTYDGPPPPAGRFA